MCQEDGQNILKLAMRVAWQVYRNGRALTVQQPLCRFQTRTSDVLIQAIFSTAAGTCLVC